MTISVFPEASSAGSTVSAFAASISEKNITLEQENNFEAGSYTLTCAPTSTDVTAIFVNDTSILTTQVTVSGTISFTLSSDATKVFLTAKNNATVFPTIVTIDKTANTLTSTDIGNGTLDTINTTGAYNQTGLLGVLVIGGGGFGSMGGIGSYCGTAGGAPGVIATDVVYANTATTVTIGAKGVARNTVAGSDTAPTNSSFGNLIAPNSTNSFINGGAGGNAGNTGGAGNASQTFPSWNGNSTTGGGGGTPNFNNNNGGAGAGSGIGTGGAGGNKSEANTANANPVNAGADATGKGAGGGAGPGIGNSVSANNNLRVGGDGSDGVVYVLRGF
jgi:hypothetical protein